MKTIHFGGYDYGAPDHVGSGGYYAACEGASRDWSSDHGYTKSLEDVTCVACLRAAKARALETVRKARAQIKRLGARGGR